MVRYLSNVNVYQTQMAQFPKNDPVGVHAQTHTSTGWNICGVCEHTRTFTHGGMFAVCALCVVHLQRVLIVCF